jgi:hypothetical protein
MDLSWLSVILGKPAHQNGYQLTGRCRNIIASRRHDQYVENHNKAT